MKRVALVQNQSEMANYSYADCRAMLNDLKYQYTLFNSTNIKSLEIRLNSGKFDSLLLATNALQDREVRKFFESEIGKQTVENFKKSGGGIVILMQYKAATEGYDFEFLLPESVSLRAKDKPNQNSQEDDLSMPIANFAAPPFLSYPNKVNLKQVKEAAQKNTAIKEIYWHWWDIDLTSTWDQHICSKNEKEKRPLLISLQEHFKTRLVFCAIPLDWYRINELFHNIMLYACQGRHHVAVLKPDKSSDLSFEYLTQRLSARKVGFGVYTNGTASLPELIENIKSGIHNVLLIENSLKNNEIFTIECGIDLDKRLINGKLKIITISEDQNENGKLVKIHGHKNPALEAFSLLMPRISHELSSGFLDGSFRGTVSGLQDLTLLQNGKIDQEIFMLKPSLRAANKHDHGDGSYDEVFGATVSLLWLRAKGLALKHDSTKKQLNGYTKSSKLMRATKIQSLLTNL